MATKKQRRRREKGRRHEYEYVYLDESGEEVPVEEPEPKPRAEKRAATAGTKPKAGSSASSSGQRVVEPPTWTRVFRRAAIFLPIMLVFLYIARPKGVSTVAIVLQALLLGCVLILFMYVMDSFLYRSYLKKQAKRTGGSPPKTK
jgi:hypothetical protein